MSAPTEETSSSALVEVVVTANLRSEALHDVPAAIAALSGSFLVGLLFQTLPGASAYYSLLLPVLLVALMPPLVRARIRRIGV